jgi:hypothetical protein
MRRRNWAALGLIFVMAGCGISFDDTNLPSHSPTKIKTSPSPAASPAPKKAAEGRSATFRHFKVTVTRLTQTKSQAKLLAKVCVVACRPILKATGPGLAGTPGQSVREVKQSSRHPARSRERLLTRKANALRVR